MSAGTFQSLVDNPQLFLTNNTLHTGIFNIISNNILSDAFINWMVIGKRKNISAPYRNLNKHFNIFRW